MRIPPGNLLRLPFYIATRELATPEKARFFDEARFLTSPVDLPGLPEGIGYEPASAVLELWKPGAPMHAIEAPDVVEDAPGEFHALTVVGLDELGVWTYRGRGRDSEGNPLAAGPKRTFTVS